LCIGYGVDGIRGVVRFSDLLQSSSGFRRASAVKELYDALIFRDQLSLRLPYAGPFGGRELAIHTRLYAARAFWPNAITLWLVVR